MNAAAATDRPLETIAIVMRREALKFQRQADAHAAEMGGETGYTRILRRQALAADAASKAPGATTTFVRR